MEFSRGITFDKSDVHAKGQMSNAEVTEVKIQFECTYGNEMMHKICCGLGEVLC